VGSIDEAEATVARIKQRVTEHATRDEWVAPSPSLRPTSRERIDTWLRIDLVDDRFAVDWAPPEH
jgi:hypothetical protein